VKTTLKHFIVKKTETEFQMEIFDVAAANLCVIKQKTMQLTSNGNGESLETQSNVYKLLGC
jgi:hypothetical protein